MGFSSSISNIKKIKIIPKLNKQFDYKNYKFNISVELNTREEKRIGGKTCHTVITNCLGGNNFYVKEEIESSKLFECIEEQHIKATKYVDQLTNQVPKSKDEQLLIGMGFS